MKICVLAGDGVGPEIVEEAVRILKSMSFRHDFTDAPVGGRAYQETGHPLPEKTLSLAQSSDAILFGAVGDFTLDKLPRELRPEQAILGLRKELNLFANFRPAIVYPELVQASTLKPEVVAGLDILIIRELTGDIYFGKPRGINVLASGEREGFDTMRYSESEIARVAHVAFSAARKRGRRLCSVDKANVLDTMQLWREVVTSVGNDYPDVELRISITGTMLQCSY